jgi:kanamycin kinase
LEKCPFTWAAEDQSAYLDTRATAGRLDPAGWSPDFAPMSSAEVLDLLNDPPPVDRLAVCHGDACAPNTLLDDTGGFVGHVDLGSLGIADRWADLAVATRGRRRRRAWRRRNARRTPGT